MTEGRITEAGAAQFPMVRHAEEVGWTPLTPRAALELRGGQENMLFRRVLEETLRRFNTWMDGDAARAVVERIEALPATIDGNREVLAWLRGERQAYDDAERRHRPVRLIDFERPDENALHVTWGVAAQAAGAQGQPRRRDVRGERRAGGDRRAQEPDRGRRHRARGGAVAALRGADAGAAGRAAALQRDPRPRLLVRGDLNASRRYLARWKERPGEGYRFAAQSFFEPTDFLRTLRDWILFYVEDGETRKTVLRQHQRRAVERIVERCAEPAKRRGLIWHTQGSGKTFTLLTAARLILERTERFGNPTVVVVVDRTELEGQLKRWVERLLGEMRQQDIPVWRTHSKEALRELLATDKRGLILSLIHKFGDLERDANTRSGVYVFIDEAHRSVARELGTYLMAALPAATIIGFTGTPVARTAHGQGTFKIFGADDAQGYLHKYAIADSIDDETTLPIRYAMAPSELTVPAEQLDREFLSAAGADGVTDVEELNRVLDRAVRLRTFLTAGDRIRKVAAFVARHYREQVAPLGYKVLLVAVNREACARYKQALDALLPPAWSAAVYTGQDDDATERPLVARYQIAPAREPEVLLDFKRPGREPRILIVTDKLLTGFDAPLLSCLYLDKPMRDHVLLQAIARVNRPYVDAEGIRKRAGLIVDFIGVLRELRTALQFDTADVSGAIADLDLLQADLIPRLARCERELAGDGAAGRGDSGAGMDDAALEELVYRRLLDPDARARFLESFKEIEALWEILSPAAALRDHVAAYRRLAQVYAAVRAAYAERGGFVADLAHKTRRLVQEGARQDGPGRLTAAVTFDAPTVRRLRETPGPSAAKVFNLVRGLRQEIGATPEDAPLLFPLRERAERVLHDLETRQTTGGAALDYVEKLVAEREEISRAAQRSGLPPRAFAVYWRLKDSFSMGEDAALAVAREAEALTARFPNAAVSPEERRRLRAALYKPLLSLHKDERAQVVEHVLALVLQPADDA